MNKNLTIFFSTAALTFSGILVSGNSAEATSPAPWCLLDDPAEYRSLKKKADGNRVVCPTLQDTQKLPLQIALDLPCGRKIVFRKIIVPANSLLDHAEISMGNFTSSNQPGTNEDLISSLRTEYLSGSFSQGTGERNPLQAPEYNNIQGRSFYIGKYEILAHQYDLWKEGFLEKTGENLAATCEGLQKKYDKTKVNKVRPAQKIGWFDAVAFSRAYTNWLLEKDRKLIAEGLQPSLPWEQGSTSYLRLPTESEWEFAARGGELTEGVNSGVYSIRDRKKKVVRPGSAKEVAVFSGAGGKILKKPKAAGLKAPNLFGIYDMVGNVDEIVYDMFRLTRPDRIHGQAGGFMVKGGNFISREQQMRVGTRREVPFFQTFGEPKSKTTGFRLVISVPTFPYAANKNKRWGEGVANTPLNKALDTAKADLSSIDNTNRNEADDQLNDLKGKLESGKLKQADLLKKLEKIQGALEKSNVELNEKARAERRERYKAVIFAAYNVSAMGRRLYAGYSKLNEVYQKFNATERKPFAKRIAEEHRKLGDIDLSLSKTFNFYVTTLKFFSQEEESEVAEAISNAERELNFKTYEAPMKISKEIIAQLRKSGSKVKQEDLDKWLSKVDPALKKRTDKKKNLEQYR